LGQRTQIQKLTDKELMVSYRNSGNEAFLGELFCRYADFVFYVCLKYLKNKELSQDMAMQVFEKLVLDLKSRQIEQFKPWLYTVAKNACLMQLRAKKIQFSSIDDERYQLPVMKTGSDLHPMEEITIEEKEEALKSALNALDERQKTCVELFYLEHKSYQEISGLTGFDFKQVKSHIQNGKRNIKNYLLDHTGLFHVIFVILYLSHWKH